MIETNKNKGKFQIFTIKQTNNFSIFYMAPHLKYNDIRIKVSKFQSKISLITNQTQELV
jgi:hypothetical protein